MAGSPKGKVDGEVVKVVGRVTVERFIEGHPPQGQEPRPTGQG